MLGAIQGFNIQSKCESVNQSATDLNAYLSPEVPDGNPEEIKLELNSSTLSNHQTDKRQNESKNICQDSSRDTSKFC